MDCIFCKIVSGLIPARKIMETDNSLAFLDAFPVARGHTLVIPKKHYEKVQQLSKEDNADLFETVRILTSKVDALTGSTLFAVHNGRGAGQEVPHVHVHLIPRSQDDTAGPVHSMFTKRPAISERELDELQKRLA